MDIYDKLFVAVISAGWLIAVAVSIIIAVRA